MFVFLSKTIPFLIYPLGFVLLLLLGGLLFGKHGRVSKTLVLLAVVLLWIASTRWCAYTLVRSLEWQNLPAEEIPTADAIVVLGGGTYPQIAPRPMVEINGAGDRVLYAAHLYRQGKAPILLLSGGTISWMNEDQTSTPALEMQSLLQEMGIPPDALQVQPASQNTREDALYTAALLRERGISRVILVTSAIHMPRSIALFRNEGIDVIPAPADFTVTETGWEELLEPNLLTQFFNALPKAENLSLTSNALKEYLGILAYHLQGWIP